MGLLGSFVSRNNDVDGYWALGKLYKHALETNAPTVCVDLVRLAITPPNDSFAAMALHFQQLLAGQLKARCLPVNWVRAATVCVEFGRKKSNTSPGDLFNCVVMISDDRGREHLAAANGACWIHDPAKESRSTRV